MSKTLYTRDILRMASSIPGQVRFEALEASSEVRSPTCGSRMRTRAELDAEGRLQNLAIAVEACAFGQAASALMATHAIGRSAAEVARAMDGVKAWLAGDDQASDAWPGLDVLAPARSRTGRHGAILLPFRALLAAMVEAR